MAIIWNKIIPRWGGTTIEPPEAKKDEGYLIDDVPPASWENWLRKGTYEALDETRDVIEGIDTQLAQLTNPNLLINGDFQIWQRGTSFTANTQNQYTADRWVMLGATDTLNKVDKVTEGLKITTLTRELYFRQRLENPNMLGKTVTASCSVDGIIYSFPAVINTESFNPKIVTPWGVFYTEYDVANNILSTSFKIDASKTITINWVKLELGSVATPFYPKSYAEELASCQRYYLDNAIGVSSQLDANNIYILVPMPVSMRVLPSLKTVLVNNGGGIQQSGFAVLVHGLYGSSLAILLSKTSHGLSAANAVINGLDAEIY